MRGSHLHVPLAASCVCHRRDVLGAAKTGSGKTLSFVVPVLERLFHERWSREDGLGALILSPTRELAMQIFEVLRAVGKFHWSLSAGLVCGGKDFWEEAAVIGSMNILVATPGRFQQHMEQSPDLDLAQLRIVVLDEADRCLDIGFRETVVSIVRALPAWPQRQTLLFSATQTKSVQTLANLSLHEPEYIAVHEEAASATPAGLAQTYCVSKAEDKLNLLYSFIRTHLKAKTIVFASACKQVRFLYEVFRRIRPGVPVMQLHGRQKQTKRMAIYYEFLKKSDAVLFATDIAARGLDFPAVDWVVQLDCPEDVASYIHRVGRTARFKSSGAALLVLTPREAEGMVPALVEARIPLKQIKINPNTALCVTPKVAAEVAADKDLKYLAQRAFVSYVRSVHLQPNKDVFDVDSLPLEELATSLGLPAAPRVRVLEGPASREALRSKKNESLALRQVRAELEAEQAAKAGGAARAVAGSSSEDESDSSDGEDVMTLKRSERAPDTGDVRESLLDERDLEGLEPWEQRKIREITAATLDMRGSKAGQDNSFKRMAAAAAGGAGSGGSSAELAGQMQQHAERMRQRIQASSARDKELERERIRHKHKQAKLAARGLTGDEDGGEAGGVGVQLATAGSKRGRRWDTSSESGDDSGSESSASSSGSSSSGGSGSEAEDMPAADAEAMALAMLASRRKL